MSRKKRTPPPPPTDTSPTQPAIPENKFPVVVKNKGGRPEEYSEYVADYICKELSKGRTLMDICGDKDMPERHTVIRWADRHPEFYSAYHRARQDMMNNWAEGIVRQTEDADEINYKVVDLRVKTKQWLMARLMPTVYGEKVQQQITGAGGGPIQSANITINAADLAPDAREAIRQALLLAKKPDGEE